MVVSNYSALVYKNFQTEDINHQSLISNFHFFKDLKIIQLRVYLVLLFLFSSTISFSQSILDLEQEGSEKGKHLREYLVELEQKHEIGFYFVDDWLDKIIIDESFAKRTLREMFNELFAGSDINFIEINPNVIVFVRDPAQSLLRYSIIREAIREQKKIQKINIGTKSQNSSKQWITLTGSVTRNKSKEPIVGGSLLVTDINVGAVTDNEGKFQLRIPAGPHVISLSSVSYEEKVIDLEIYTDGMVSFELEEKPNLLDEIIVHDKSVREITTRSMGLTQLSLAEIKKAPALLGEVDIIKQIQNLPGVNSVGEASSGFNVRGGSVDQNLILYDGLPVFNSSHVFGFFSSFNAEAVRNVTFYKGNIPAEFGGRISSVLDIRSKEGNYEKWGASGGIGIISTNLMVNGPIKKNKTAIAASFRATYSDWLINTVRSNYVDLSQSSASFYDGTLKLTHRFSEKTKLTFSGYKSHDQFRLQGDSSFRWDTSLASLRFDHEFTKSFSTSLSAGVGSYSYNVFDKDTLSGFDLKYRLTYPTVKLDFYLLKGNHKISAGVQGLYYDFNPGTFTPSSVSSNKRSIQMDIQKSIETGIYIADEFKVTENFYIDAGLRFSMFQQVGPANINIYSSGVPREPLTIIDTLHFSTGEKIKSFYNAEPRIGFRYELSPSSSFKLAYNRTVQYLHLVTNTTAITPVDIWQPSGYYFEPQKADQLSFGFFKNFKEKTYETFIEVYYKMTNNVVDFKDGANLILNQQIEADLLQGKSRSYGAETQFSKKTGRLTGSIGYTYSRSFQTIQGNFPEESINNGKEYRSNFDQPHNVNISWKYNISRRYFFTGGFVYHTGRPITLPLTAFTVDNVTVSSFSDRNAFRIPDYHRLDLGFVVEGSHKRKKIWDGTFTFSVYNVYARKNPYSVFFKEVRPGILRPYRLSIIGTALPSISYSFKI